VIGAGAVGSELLKNLVLPGIGAFTLVDSARVREADLGNNFFVTGGQHGSSGVVGQPRASVVSAALTELNGHVRGYSVDDEDAADIVERRPDFFRQFSLVVATQLAEEPLLQLARLLHGLAVPLVVVRAYGLVGFLRVAGPDHYVAETRPDNPVVDLRIANPFPELLAWAASFNLAALDSAQHSHVPMVVILVQAALAWKAAHGDALPKTRQEREEFKTGIVRMARNLANEVNFQEALAAAHKACVVVPIPEDVTAVLADDRCEHPTKADAEFWVLAAALKGFVASEGVLPLSGVVPDMVAHTEVYVHMQRVYQAKAEEDVAAVMRRVDAIAERLKRPRIAADAVRAFCKNAAFIKVCKFRPIEEEYAVTAGMMQGPPLGSDDPQDPLPWYLMIRIADAFRTKHGRYPGMFDDQVESDVKALRDVANTFLAARGLQPSLIKDDVLHEISRYGATELHNIAAFLGGVAAQEVIKLISHCFVPVNNTLVFNGIGCSTKTFAL
jgi:amyloid beta precursor protein binding protein 1